MVNCTNSAHIDMDTYHKERNGKTKKKIQKINQKIREC